MQTIKKYANRKLYHINRKRYITLDGIAQLVQSGEQVQVFDNETGEDITAGILAQVVLQVRGGKNGQLPTTVLTGIIQLGGDTLANARRAIFASLGAQDMFQAEIRRRLDIVVARGDLSAEEGTRLKELLLQSDFSQSGDHLVVSDAEVPSRNDVVQLHAQVDALLSAVEQIVQRQPDSLTSIDRQSRVDNI